MKNLTRIIVFAVVLLSLTVSTVFAYDSDLGGLALTPEEMFEEYYNGGVYTRISDIYLTEEAADIHDAFHGPVVKEKTTWFDFYEEGEMLLMDTNSGYRGTDVELPEEHFYIENGEVVVDYTIAPSANVSFYTMKHFTTLTNDLTTLTNDLWVEQADGSYVSYDEAVIEAALGFAAPCFTNISKTTGDEYIKLTKVAVHSNAAEGLIFRLYGMLDSTETVVAYTTIVKGVDGMQDFIDTATKN